MKGDGAVYLRGTTWWLRFSRDGVEHRMSSGTNVKTKATAKLREERATLAVGQFVSVNLRNVKIGELVEDCIQHYMTLGMTTRASSMRAHWRLHLVGTYEHVRASQFGSAHQRDYREKRLAAGAARATINREVATLSRAFHLAAESEPPKVAKVPKFMLFVEDNARKVFITDEQYAKIQAAASRAGLWARVLVDMAFLFGWRRGELLGLRVRHINVPERYVRLDDSKNGDPREVPMTEGLAVMVQALIAGKPPEDLVFPPVTTMRYVWNNIKRAAGCPEVCFHDFRRTSARSKRSAGVDTSVIMEMQGWRSAAMFKRYAIVSAGDKLEAMNRTVAAQKARNEA